MTTKQHGYVRGDELQAALANGRLSLVFEDTGLRIIQGFGGSYSVYGIERCELSKCGEGARLPETLRAALEAYWARQIQHHGPPVTYSVEVSRQRVWDTGVGTGNWVGLRNRDGCAVQLGIQSGHITNLEWRQPHLKLLGLDLDRKKSIYEYAGEVRSGGLTHPPRPLCRGSSF